LGGGNLLTFFPAKTTAKNLLTSSTANQSSPKFRDQVANAWLKLPWPARFSTDDEKTLGGQSNENSRTSRNRNPMSPRTVDQIFNAKTLAGLLAT